MATTTRKPLLKLKDRPLGALQRHVLESVSQAPYPSGGWQWESPAGTVRILESLQERGLVALANDGEYSITSTGLALLDEPAG